MYSDNERLEQEITQLEEDKEASRLREKYDIMCKLCRMNIKKWVLLNFEYGNCLFRKLEQTIRKLRERYKSATNQLKEINEKLTVQ